MDDRSKHQGSWVEARPGIPALICVVSRFVASSGAQGFIASAAYVPEVMQDCKVSVTLKDEGVFHGLALPASLNQEASVLLASNGLGIRRLKQLLQEGNIDLKLLSDHIGRISQAAVLKKLSQEQLQEKLYCGREVVLPAVEEGSSEQRVELKACIHLLASDVLECSLSTEATVGPAAEGQLLGSSATNCRAFAHFALLTLFGPTDVSANHGSLSVFRVNVQPECLLDAPREKQLPDAAALAYHVPDLIYGCFASASHQTGSTELTAESSASLCCLQWTGAVRGMGIHIEAGGTGALEDQDGSSATVFPSGFRSTPIEVTEQSGVVFRHRELMQDSGGAGCFRGGLGVELEVSVPTSVSFRCLQLRDDGPCGRVGGKAGVAGAWCESGDTLTIKTAGGGGFGHPTKRSRTAVLHDVRNGYVSHAAAVSEYGLETEQLDSGVH